MKSYLAKRDLLYSLKGQKIRHQFSVGIREPYLLTEGSVNFIFDPGTAGCTIEFEGLPERPIEVYGADTLQAVELASNVEPYLSGLRKKYDIYWLSGEPYFEDE
ncbi:hypothetical protein [Solimonas sp. K1W22B-7]|uniref:hypothetical protein n=1 Tax=Solimonas sp. K1W22B-7 TaxID=2303331 RepID=UPI0013C4A5E3|nr:hypothetical protein [Solimonas sp. K1W22B-7]